METPEVILKEMLTAMGASYSEIERIELAGQEIFSIKTDDPKTLIGSHGDAVHALDTLVKKIYEKRHPASLGSGERGAMFLVDVGEYRSRQIKDLQTKALMMAERARSLQYDVELSPMTAYERLIVHTTLEREPHVKTESLGDGRNRRVVIKYAAE